MNSSDKHAVERGFRFEKRHIVRSQAHSFALCPVFIRSRGRGSDRFGPPGNHQGFTLLEVIAVLVVLGIICAVAFASMAASDNDLVIQTDALKSYIKYAQSKSMETTSTVYGVGISRSTDNYWIFSCSSTSTCTWQTKKIKLPGADSNPAYNKTGGQDQIQTSKVNVSISGNSDRVIIFDKIGRPFLGKTGDLHFTEPLEDTVHLMQMNTPLNITLKDDHADSKTITIIPDTGFIH